MATDAQTVDVHQDEHKKKKDKRKKDRKKEKARSKDPVVTTKESTPKTDAAISDTADSSASKKHKDGDKKSRKRDREARRAEKKELLEKIPRTDDDGIAYTKLQIRRMMKRVKRGLAPVPTEEEERERRRQEALERKEDEAEFAGLIIRKDDDRSGGDTEEENDHDDTVNQEGDTDHDIHRAADDNDDFSAPPTKKKNKRSKPIPSDYVCSACSNKRQPAHWIYDCPDKVTMRGTNQLSKKLRGIHNPDAKKVFISGLPFDVKRKDVEQMFQACGKVVSCKLLTFEDTGRCKGQAFMTFETEEGAKAALKLSDTTIENANNDAKQKKKKKEPKGERKRQELKLKVTKMKNRSLTKNHA